MVQSNIMVARRPDPTFAVVFKAEGVFPESIPSQRVFDALNAVQRLIRPGELDEDEDSALRLIGVVRGSAAYKCYVEQDERAIGALRSLGAMLRGGKIPDDVAPRMQPLADLSRIARSLECTIVIRRDREDVLATIVPESYEQLVGSLLVTGDTTVSGEIKRVGGATERRCTLSVPGRPCLLYCDVASPELARELGKHLYEEVVVSGTAQWLRTNWDIVGLKINAVHQVRGQSLWDSIRSLRAAGGDAWDGVEDPDALLEQLRG